jgi:Raf kinase inhibitor-like YbhB/YbcL family protein
MESILFFSPDFPNSQPIPEKFSYYSKNCSPSFQWSDLPAGTQNLALIADDPDAPVGIWVHWVIYNIPAALTGFPLEISKDEQVHGIGTQGMNDFHKVGYDGPCPPPGKAHRYFFDLYALDTNLNLPSRLTKETLLKAISGHILAQGQWMGTYQSN